MPLIIEDGSGIAGANSFATVAEARAYGSARGLVFPALDATVEAALVNAADFLETFQARYKGSKTDAANALAWPRKGVFLYSSATEFPNDEIPTLLKNAQCQLAFDATSTTLQPSYVGQEVKRKKVDVLEIEYAETGTGSATVTPQFKKAEAMLEPLLNTSAGFALRTRRI